jgi:hypothetical protein
MSIFKSEKLLSMSEVEKLVAIHGNGFLFEGNTSFTKSQRKAATAADRLSPADLARIAELSAQVDEIKAAVLRRLDQMLEAAEAEAAAEGER